MAVTQIGSVGTAHLEATGGLATIAATKNGITAGSTVVVRVTCGDAFTITNVSNGAGLTRTVADISLDWVAGTQRLAIYSFENHPGGNFTFTVNYSGLATFRGICIIELTPCTLEGKSSSTGTSAAPSSTNVVPTPTVDGEYIIGYAMGATALTKAAAWTEILNEVVNTSDTEGLAQAAKAAVAATWTMTSGIWGAIAASYKQIMKPRRPVVTVGARRVALGFMAVHSVVGRGATRPPAAAYKPVARNAITALVRTPLPITRRIVVGKGGPRAAAAAPPQIKTVPTLAQVRTPLLRLSSSVGRSFAPQFAERAVRPRPVTALVRISMPGVRSIVLRSQISTLRNFARPIVTSQRIPLPAVRSQALFHSMAAPPPPAGPAQSLARPLVVTVRSPLPVVRSSVLQYLIFVPSVAPPVPGPSYYPWPQGGERGAHSSLGSRRRSAISKALHEASEREEPEKPKKKRRPQRPAETTSEVPATPELVIGGEARTIARSARIEAELAANVAGHGQLQGRSIEKSQVCVLNPVGGARGNLRARKLGIRAGRLEPRGIENLTDEQMLQLLEEL